MAEHVQAALDDMVAPLRDLMDRGIFSEDEIKTIVARRRASEYLLRRRAARKADFLRYLEAEMDLEKLRKLRSKKLSDRQDRKSTDEKKKKKNGGLPIGDVHIVQHIHLLFIRTLRKFRSDVSLHLQHAEFAKESKSYNKLTTIYTEALQVHPRNVGLWIEAASHEFFGFLDPDSGVSHGGGSIQSARVLLQRALRINATAQDLWIQYFCLELHFIQKLRGRREILQITNKETDETNTEYSDAPIPAIVYKNAIKAIPDNVAFRMKFLDVCRLFPETEKLETQVAESMEKDFSDKSEAWIARAVYVAGKQNEAVKATGFVIDAGRDAEKEQPRKKQRADGPTDAVLKIIAESVELLPTAEMYLQAIQFAREYLQERVESSEETITLIDALFQSAHEEDDITSSHLALEQSDYLASSGKVEAAIQCLKDFNMKKSSTIDVSVSLQLAQLFKLNNESDHAVSELERCLSLTPVHDANYMRVLLELFGAMINNEAEYAEVKRIFEKILLLAPNKNPTFEARFGIGSVAHACLQFAQESSKQEKGEVRKVINLVVERSTYCDSAEGKSEEELQVIAAFFDDALEQLKPKNKKEKMQQKLFLRRLYDKAISLFASCAPEISDLYRSRKDEFMYS